MYCKVVPYEYYTFEISCLSSTGSGGEPVMYLSQTVKKKVTLPFAQAERLDGTSGSLQVIQGYCHTFTC